MKNLILSTALTVATVSGVMTSSAFAAGDPVPCEKMLGDLRAAEATATLSEADKTKVAELRQQGIDRCKADDDAGADAFFADAMNIIGK